MTGKGGIYYRREEEIIFPFPPLERREGVDFLSSESSEIFRRKSSEVRLRKISIIKKPPASLMVFIFYKEQTRTD